mgnify:CR=1 FL=1
MIKYFELIRVKQWYKNVVVFIPLVFAGKFLDLKALILTLIGFFALCLVSSSNYIINDLKDIEKDRRHPEKKFRPIASGKVKKWEAIIICSALLAASIFISVKLSISFFLCVVAIFVLTQGYTFYLRNEQFLDIIMIAINFVIRAVSGAFIINVRISPWLILCTFFLSLFLSAGKREADIRLLKDKAVFHKRVLKDYNIQITNALMIISTSALILSYALYSFLSIYPMLIYTIPFALYAIFRYLYLVYSGSEIGRHPEKAILDKRLLIGSFLWLISIFFIILYSVT